MVAHATCREQPWAYLGEGVSPLPLPLPLPSALSVWFSLHLIWLKDFVIAFVCLF